MSDDRRDGVLASLVREDLRSVPGPALAAAEKGLAGDPGDARHQLDACLAALAAGEPKRALSLLSPSRQSPRVSAALTAWARQLDGNWYPGGIGAEASLDPTGLFVEARPGEPTDELLEQIVSRGPTGLATPRTLLEMSLRDGAAAGVQQAVAVAAGNLDALAQYAAGRGLPDVGRWAVLATADIAHRAGMAEAEPLLAETRAQSSAARDPVLLALSFLVEGDWYAAPGSSPESLGWDLAPQRHASPLPAADLGRATTCYDQAETVLGGAGPPRFRAALALRRAMLDRGSGDDASRRRHLGEAVEASRSSGDSAGYHLAAIHRLVADIDEGRLGQHALDLGGGWHRPEQGPVADILTWAETVGSRSWCVGLGRLLERCAGYWAQKGSAARSRIAYVAALQLIATDPGVPSQTLITAVAHADAQSNLTTNALLRLERGFGSLLADTGSTDGFAFAQKLEASLVMVWMLRDKSRGSAAGLMANRMALLRDQLAKAIDSLRAALPEIAGPVPATMEELLATLDTMRGDGSLEAQAGRAEDSVVLMQHMQLRDAGSSVDMIDVLAALTRADAAQRAGQIADADRWLSQAVTAAERPNVEATLLPLVLVSARRPSEARAAILRRAHEIRDSLQLPLWLLVKDYEQAEQALARLEASGASLDGWQELLSRAELQLARGEHIEARRLALAGIAAFEDSVRLLLRDPDRLDACDQPDVAALYSMLAIACLPATGEPTEAEADASFEASELARSLSHDDTIDTVDAVIRQAWQSAAAEYAAFANRLLAALASGTGEQATDGFATLDRLDGVLASAERAVDAADPGVLLRRTAPPQQATAAQLRRALPDGTLVLEYLAVGDDLLGWAMTRDVLRPVRQNVRFRDLALLVRAFHASCVDGRAVGTELATLLLEPFADLLRTHSRVVVVPFGPLNLVPFHALRLDGVPLALDHVVSYSPRAASLLDRAPDLDRPAAAARPLVVADPAFDPAAHPSLQHLPGSRAEAAAVAASLHVPSDDVLVGPAATEAAVGARLEACDLLHVSSHGHLDELSPFASSLVLAGRDELTVADIVGLRFGTDLAVLTGCDTGRGNATLGGDLVGLTRSLLRSGVGRTVVSLWPVDDAVAPVVMHHFYKGLADGLAPAYALAGAQRALLLMSADQLRNAYVELGGDADTTGNRRRGAVLDPDLRDDEEIPEPLGGDAERYWAPFIVVG